MMLAYEEGESAVWRLSFSMRGLESSELEDPDVEL